MMRTPESDPREQRGSGSRKRVVRGFAGLGLWLLGTVAVAGPDAAAIMRNADRMSRPAYEVITMRMELRGGDRAFDRELVWRIASDRTGRASLFKFTEPASLRGEGTLIVERDGNPNAIWHYMPATRNVRRIAGEHRQNRFMGTEFLFEDFEGLKLDKSTFALLRSEPCRETSRCYVIEGRVSDPEERAGSTYERKIYWVDETTSAIVKVEFYDPGGTLAKSFESSDFRSFAGFWRPRRQVMTDLRNGHSTALVELQRTLNEPFDRYYVGQQYLRSE